MANRIELEESFILKNDDRELLRKIDEKGYKFLEQIVEEDTYFTDKAMSFVKERVCLRTRKTNDNRLELTFKPRTDSLTEQYGKKEINIELKIEDYQDIKFMLNSLGFDEYVSFKKDRTVYTKRINGFQHNIMIDKIEGVGSFVELEILANNEEEKEQLHDELDRFVEEFECHKLEEKKAPYRDIVKAYFDQKRV